MEWEIVMGLEVHIELSTESKIFCGCSTKFGSSPNTHCCPICLGMPGVLPVLNENVLKYAVKAGLALNCSINLYNKFDRKNYFYPDLPKAYQISQLYIPYAQNGHVSLTKQSGEVKEIRIHEIHMEEDACKLIHQPNGSETLLDYNRCGIPLLEIVSEPDFRDSEEVIAYLSKLRSIIVYLGISDCRLEEGSMRADVNLSVRPKGTAEFGTRTEMKNINSFRSIERAIAYESKRQIALIKKGEAIIQETLRWDEEKGITRPMRSKEDAQDYRYFPEPDIPPIRISKEYLQSLKDEQPEFEDSKINRYVNELGLAEADARIIASIKQLADLFDNTCAMCKDPSEVRFWIVSQILYFMNERNLHPEDIKLSPDLFANFISTIKQGKISRQTGKQVFEKMFFSDDKFNIDEYILENGLQQVDDSDLLYEIITAVLKDNPKAVAQYKGGQTKIIGYVIGQVMKKMAGKADPMTVKSMVEKALEE